LTQDLVVGSAYSYLHFWQWRCEDQSQQEATRRW